VRFLTHTCYTTIRNTRDGGEKSSSVMQSKFLIRLGVLFIGKSNGLMA